jgi:penicillin-binding protein-related factor A (putative recombinase)
MFLEIHVIHHPVDHIHSVEIQTDLLLALVLLIISDLHQTVDLNASAILSVHQIEHVSMKNVEIHVLDHVATMLDVKSSIIMQYVHVILTILVIHSQVVIPSHHHVRLKLKTLS